MTTETEGFLLETVHIVPIFGVRGLNNGFSDAANIGWKLGWVLNNKAGKELLNSYSPEERGNNRRFLQFKVFKIYDPVNSWLEIIVMQHFL